MSNIPLLKSNFTGYSINQRFTYALIVVVTIILTCISTVVIFIDISRINNELETRLGNAIELAQTSLKVPMWNFSFHTIEGFIDALFLDDEIIYVNISEEHRTIATRSRPEFQEKELSYFIQSSGFVVKTSDIFYERSKVGTIQLVVSRESIRRELIAHVSVIITLTIAVIVAISLTSLVISRRFVSQPLAKLQNSATLIAEGDLEANIDISKDDEIGKLARDFNAMRESIKELFEALRQSNRTLELRVEGRTQELQQELAVRKQAETDLQQQKQALENTLEELKRTQDQLIQSEKLAGLGTLVAGVAHEINNPVNFVHNGSENVESHLQELKRFIFDIAGDDASTTLRQNFEDRFDRLFTYLHTITNGSRRIKGIVDDLRTFSRLDEAKKTTVQIVEGLESSLRLVESEYRQQVMFICDFRANPSIECWPSQLNQVYMNIMVNACQAIVTQQNRMADESPGMLTIHTAIKGEHVEIGFQDTGCGLPKDVQEKMFEPFYTTKPVGEGTGLGMSISYGIIEKHQGSIIVDSEINEGTTITLRLPLKATSSQSTSASDMHLE